MRTQKHIEKKKEKEADRQKEIRTKMERKTCGQSEYKHAHFKLFIRRIVENFHFMSIMGHCSGKFVFPSA